MIDAVSPAHPVLLSKFDRSAFLANGLALAVAGIDDATVILSSNGTGPVAPPACS